MSKPVKILILSHSSELGGAERSMIDLFDYWTKGKLVEPHIIVRTPLKNMIPELKKRGWKYYPIHYTNWSQRKPSKRAEDVFRNARENARAIAEIEKVVEKVKPDVVMTNTIVSPWAALVAHFKQLPHVWFVREYGDIDHQHVFEIGREKMYQDIDTLSDLVVTNSKTLATHVAEIVASRKVSALYTPFDLEKLDRKASESAKNPFKYEDSLKTIITGRIAPSKGQDEAARAIGELNKSGISAELAIIGEPADPQDSKDLEYVIKEYGIEDRVHILGHQGNPLPIVKHADVGIMASQQEAFGRVTFEYMACGRPVVGASSGATPELVEVGKNGYLYKRGNVDSLTNQLKKYANDRQLVEKHGAQARLHAEEMMQGECSAEELYNKIKKLQKQPAQKPQPLHFSRKWLDYPLIAQKYIDESQVLSFKRLFVIKVRAAAKFLYFKLTDLLNNGRKNY